MPGKTFTQTDAVLNVLRGTNLSGVTPFVGLLSAAPSSDADSGTELSGGGYARQSVTFTAPATDSGNVRKIDNSADITFPVATANWPEVVAAALYTASTGGSMLYWGSLATPRTVPAGDVLRFAAGALVVKED